MLKVAQHTYSIHTHDWEWSELIKTVGPDFNPHNLGYTHHELQGIWVRTFPWEGRVQPSLAIQKSTLLHEILHVCMAQFGCNLTNVRYHKALDLEEFVVSTMEPWLFVVLLENPDVFAWITS